MRSRDSKGVSLAARLLGGKLPPDVMADARRRLRIASLAVFFAFAIMLAAHWVQVQIGWHPFVKRALVLACLLSMSVSLFLYFLFGKSGIRTQTLLNLALLAEFQLCMALSHMELKGPDPRDPNRFGVSIAALIIVLAPVLIPAPPWKTLLASLFCALAGPLAAAHQGPFREATMFDYSFRQYFNLYAVNFVAAGLALAPSFVLLRLREELKEAVELGSYRLVSRLGQGGMGEVWKAQHRLLVRPAAIKLIGSELQLDPVVLKRFEQEVQATALLRNPHTITVYDYGTTPDGAFYYVMELLEGMDLAELIRGHGPLPPARVVFLLAQVLESLQEAHASGLVHRDIKPENVYVCELGQMGDFVKVLDFGLALSVSVPEQARLSLASAVHGTPAFMAPEQALEQPVDGRADLYAVGCLGYWLLTGTTVFEADSPVQHIVHHVGTPPDPPSTRGGKPVPPELETILLSCLEKSPPARPASAAELRALLLECPLPDRWGQAEADTWWEKQKGAPAGAPATATASA